MCPPCTTPGNRALSHFAFVNKVSSSATRRTVFLPLRTPEISLRTTWPTNQWNCPERSTERGRATSVIIWTYLLWMALSGLSSLSFFKIRLLRDSPQARLPRRTKLTTKLLPSTRQRLVVLNSSAKLPRSASENAPKLACGGGAVGRKCGEIFQSTAFVYQAVD